VGHFIQFILFFIPCPVALPVTVKVVHTLPSRGQVPLADIGLEGGAQRSAAQRSAVECYRANWLAGWLEQGENK
jgi:hypothetical protein